MKASDVHMSQIVMPTGCLKWMFHRKMPFCVDGVDSCGPNASVVGLYDKAIRINTSDDVEMISVFFMPHTFHLIMNIPCGEFRNYDVGFDNLESVEFNDLKARVLEASTTDGCIELIEDFLLKRLAKVSYSPYYKHLTRVFRLLTLNPEIRVEQLASEACLSERQFRRVFVDHVGMKPKQMQRIMRFRGATNEILYKNLERLDDVVMKYGYTDHSHFNREFHDIAGVSPEEYLAFLEGVRKHRICPSVSSLDGGKT